MQGFPATFPCQDGRPYITSTSALLPFEKKLKGEKLMNVKEASEQVKHCEEKFAKMVEEKDSLSQEIKDLKEQRRKAVLALAGGNEAKRKEILSLEGKLGPLELKAEGLDGLIQEQSEAVKKARKELDEATKAEQAALQRFVSERENQEIQRLIAGAGQREEELFKKWTDFAVAWAQLQLDVFRTEAIPGNALEELLRGLPIKLLEKSRTGFRPLAATGSFTGLIARPFVPSDVIQPGDNPINGGEVARLIKERRVAELTKTFYHERSQKDGPVEN